MGTFPCTPRAVKEMQAPCEITRMETGMGRSHTKTPPAAKSLQGYLFLYKEHTVEALETKSLQVLRQGLMRLRVQKGWEMDVRKG